MINHALVVNILLVAMLLFVQSAMPSGIRIEGDVLVRCSEEYKGKVVIPDGVHHIAECAFMGCKNITDVVFPNGIETVGENAFSRCFGLVKITIPESVTNIGNSAFFLCWNLTNLTINAEVCDIPRAMCMRCVRLEGVKFPRGLLNIGVESFLSCRSLKAIEIPDSVTNISEQAFCGCARLERILLPGDLKCVGDEAFAGCYDLHLGDVPMQLKVLNSKAVEDNGNLSRSIADSSICGLDMIVRVAADEFLAEGYPCQVDVFALDRFVAHLNEIKIGMTFSEVDEFAWRYGIVSSHGSQVDAEGRKIHTSTRFVFHMSGYGSVYICLKYKNNVVNEILVSEAIKRAANAGIVKSPNRINKDGKRWLE